MANELVAPTKTRSESSQPETTRGGYCFSPQLDIYETSEELILYADVPGVRSEDVDLQYERGELVLHAPVRKSDDPAHPDHQEYEVGDYYRLFHIHETIDPSKISAECKNGVLTVHLPKTEAAKPKQVRVTGD